MKSVKQLPHIYRKITAPLFLALGLILEISLLGIIITVIFFNYYIQLFPTNPEYIDLKLKILKKPSNYLDFINLGLYQFNNQLQKEAEHNFQIAQYIYNKQALGSISSPYDIYQKIINQKTEVPERIKYWMKITELLPNYRDGYLQLGINLEQINKNEEAKKAFLKAGEIDPYYKKF